MKYYITTDILQDYFRNYMRLYSHPATFSAGLRALYRKHVFLSEPVRQEFPSLGEKLSDEEYMSFLGNQCLSLDESQVYSTADAGEAALIPPDRDLFAMRHFQYIDNGGLHKHDFFEMNYVFRGSCSFSFEEEIHEMQNGELCLIAPGSRHDIMVHQDETLIITFQIRKSTFRTVFFDFLTHSDLLSRFFRNDMTEASPNYLLFFTGQDQDVRRMVKNLTIEIWRSDVYSNTCAVSWTHLLLTQVLRNHGATALYYDFRANRDFPLILSYIRRHYQTVSLGDLSAFFHYSIPYMSTLIRRNTGKTYSGFLKEIRIREAKKLLADTDLKIAEIARQVGYHSADRFQAAFRQETGMSPSQWRKNTQTPGPIPRPDRGMSPSQRPKNASSSVS